MAFLLESDFMKLHKKLKGHNYIPKPITLENYIKYNKLFPPLQGVLTGHIAS
jgi:hypothetical protein